jgi:hypothetical protein
LRGWAKSDGIQRPDAKFASLHNTLYFHLAPIPTPSIIIKHVLLDKILVQHYENNSWISFKFLTLKMWKLRE